MPEKPRVLIVQDGSDLCPSARVLSAEGFATETSLAGPTVASQVRRGGYDLVILDAGAHGLGGLPVCRQLRELGLPPPILLLTAGAGDQDRIQALQAGADDCLAKPYSAGELLARAQALIRRMRGWPAGLRRFRFADVQVDFPGGQATKGGLSVPLSSKEFQLLRYLIVHRGIVISRKHLLAEVWNYQSTLTRTLDMHIASLRRKLENDPHRPRHILTRRRQGYLFFE